VPFDELLSSMKMLFGPQAQQKKLAFNVSVAPDAPASLVTDRQRLEQILKNLLSNAIKFTERAGGLHVDTDEAGNVRPVQDTGIGIADDQQSLRRLPPGRRHHQPPLRRHRPGPVDFARPGALLGGSIASSTPGQGSTFTLDCRQPCRNAPRRPMSSAAGARRPRALPPAVPAAPPAPAVKPVPLPTFQMTATARRRARAAAFHAGGRGRAVVCRHPVRPGARDAVPLPGGARRRRRPALAAEYRPTRSCWTCACPTVRACGAAALKENPQTRHIPCTSSPAMTDAGSHALGAIGYATKRHARAAEGSVPPLEAKLTQKIKRILLVEDDDRQRESVVHLISDDDVEITAVALGEQALELLKTHIRLHDHRPQAARHAGQRIARTHGTRGTVLLPAGDRLHGPQPEPRGRGGPDKYSRSIIIKARARRSACSTK
jgi:hypothetical protein